jgi:hypothetical protein
LDSEFTASYPGRQGSEVILTLQDGSTLNRRLPDLIPATAPEIRSRFLRAAEPVFGREQAQMLEMAIDGLEFEPAAARLAELASLSQMFAAQRI